MSIPNDDKIVASDTPVYAISIAAQLCGIASADLATI